MKKYRNWKIEKKKLKETASGKEDKRKNQIGVNLKHDFRKNRSWFK